MGRTGQQLPRERTCRQLTLGGSNAPQFLNVKSLDPARKKLIGFQVNKFKRTSAILLAGTALVLASSQTANAYGSGSWYVQPSSCNPGWFSGSSQYDWPNGLARASTSEDGNFCWFGNTAVTSAVHDQWGNGYGWNSAPNYVESYFPANYDGGWGGVHAWGDSGGYNT